MQPCPPWDKLEGMMTKRLSDVDQKAVRTHVDGCKDCQQTLRLIAGSTGTQVGERPTPVEMQVTDPSGIPPELRDHPRYHVTELLGAGGMGTVYRAEHRLLDRPVVLKLILPDLTQDAEMVERFRRESRLAARLAHPNIVHVYEAEQIGPAHFLVMEYVDGMDLERLVRRKGKMPVAEACEAVRQAALGLQHAFERGLVHRDIKPSNLLLGNDGLIKLLDMGLAVLKGDAPGGSRLTAKSQVLGTLDYMAPEQWQDSHEVDIRADIYSLGCTLYELLTGQPPFAGPGESSPLQQMWAHTHKPPPPLRDVRPEVPAELAVVVDRMLAKDPTRRFATPADVADALEPFAVGADLPTLLGRPSGTATRPSGYTASRRSPSRQPVNPWPWAIAALALLAAVGWLIWYLTRGPGDAGPVFTGPPLKVGVLYSNTGPMATSEDPVEDATVLAIEEINSKGGVLGRKIEIVDIDGQSDASVFRSAAETMIAKANVVTIFGCWTSDSRKAVKEVVEKYDHLLIYPLQYEGLEQSPNIFYLGAAPNQQILPAVEWCRDSNRRKVFLVGSDYIFPRAASAIIHDAAAEQGITIVGEEFLLLDAVDVDRAISKIVETKPDIILNLINGDTNIVFFRSLREAERLAKLEPIPTLSFSVTETMLGKLGFKNVVGDYAAWNYFQSIDRPQNEAFIRQFRERFGPRRVTTDPMEAAYVGVHLWAQAVQAAGSDDVKAIRQAMKEQSFEGPGGTIRIDPKTQHASKTVRIGRLMENGQYKVIYNSEKPIEPVPFPPSRSREEWNALLDQLFLKWGKQWSNPGK